MSEPSRKAIELVESYAKARVSHHCGIRGSGVEVRDAEIGLYRFIAALESVSDAAREIVNIHYGQLDTMDCTCRSCRLSRALSALSAARVEP